MGVILVRGHHADFARADDAVADHLGSVLAADVGHSLGVNRPGAFALFQQGQQVASHREGQHDLNDGRKVERVGEVGHGGGFLLEDAATGCETITASLVTLLRKVDSNRCGCVCQPLFPNLFARPITRYYQQPPPPFGEGGERIPLRVSVGCRPRSPRCDPSSYGTCGIPRLAAVRGNVPHLPVRIHPCG